MAVSYIDFVEERLELGYHYGCVGGPQFKTDIVVNGAENEQRNLNWWFPLGKWQLGERMLLDSDVEGVKEVEYLRSFHTARSGGKQGFRFKDWADYQVIGVELGTGNGVTTQWQLKKLYTAGEYSFYRAITKPVEGTVRIYLDGNEISYHLINYETGLISFAAPVSNGVVITADFEFDVPVSFEKDEIEWSLEAVRLETGETLHRLGSVMVEEMRIDLPIEWYHRDSLPYVITEPLNLGVILDVSESIQLSTESQSLSSGFKSKISYSEQTKVLIKLPNVAFNQEQLDKILAYFWVARGRLIDFLLQLNNQLRQVRFDSDSLSIKFSASSNDKRLFEVNNINFVNFFLSQETENILHLLGTDYLDYSQYQHAVNILGEVPINNGAYCFDGDSNNYISIPSHPAFSFQGKNIEISFKFKINQYNPSGINFLFSLIDFNSPNDSNNSIGLALNTEQATPRLQLRIKVNSAISSVLYIDTFANLPNNQFLQDFQSIKITAYDLTGKHYGVFYNGALKVGTGFAEHINFNNSNRAFVIGKDSGSNTGSLNGCIKEFLVRSV